MWAQRVKRTPADDSTALAIVGHCGTKATRGRGPFRKVTPSFIRKRRERERRNGEVQVTLTIPQAAIVEALIQSGRLTEADTERPELVGRALGEVLADWAARRA